MATKKTASRSSDETKAPAKKVAKKASVSAAAPTKKAAPKKVVKAEVEAEPKKKVAKASAKKAPAAKEAPVKEALVKESASAKESAPKKAPKKAPKEEAADPDAASKLVALACAEAALDKKAVNVVILDVRGKVDYADYLVVMSGRSDRQVQALARGIAEDVEQKTKTKCLSVEALPGSSWVLMDFGDVVVHVFYDDVRGYYDLESLWMDARRIPVPGAGLEVN